MSMVLAGFQTGQQYSSLLRTMVLKRVSIRNGDLSLKTLRTQDDIVLADWIIFWMWGVQEQSFDKITPKSLTVSAGSII